MFIVIGVSDDQSAKRIACAGPAEAMAEIAAQRWEGKDTVQVFNPAGVQLTLDQLADLVAALDEQPLAGIEAATLEKELLKETVWGADADVDVNYEELSLHDLTQLAATLRPGATLTIRSSSKLSPIERDSISGARPGQIRFL